MTSLTGKFIVLEGIDGSGLSTQAQLLSELIGGKLGYEVYQTKEPSEGPVGSLIRLFLAKRLEIANGPSPENQLQTANALALVFAADRLDHTYRDIIPKLALGVHVICDRYLLSSLAYQSVQGVKIDWLKQINAKALKPDLTIVLDVPAAISVRRRARKRWEVLLYEEEQQLERVRHAYLEIAKYMAVEEHMPVVVIDGRSSIADVRRSVTQEVRRLIARGSPGLLQQLSLESPTAKHKEATNA